MTLYNNSEFLMVIAQVQVIGPNIYFNKNHKNYQIILIKIINLYFNFVKVFKTFSFTQITIKKMLFHNRHQPNTNIQILYFTIYFTSCINRHQPYYSNNPNTFSSFNSTIYQKSKNIFHYKQLVVITSIDFCISQSQNLIKSNHMTSRLQSKQIILNKVGELIYQLNHQNQQEMKKSILVQQQQDPTVILLINNINSIKRIQYEAYKYLERISQSKTLVHIVLLISRFDRDKKQILFYISQILMYQIDMIKIFIEEPNYLKISCNINVGKKISLDDLSYKNVEKKVYSFLLATKNILLCFINEQISCPKIFKSIKGQLQFTDQRAIQLFNQIYVKMIRDKFHQYFNMATLRQLNQL